MTKLVKIRGMINKIPMGRALFNGAALLKAVTIAVALTCALPLVAVLVAALLGGTHTVSHLIDTVLATYLLNTSLIVFNVSLGTLVIGVGTAWLVSTTQFLGVRWLEMALVLPLAFPAYVLAYAYTQILDHPGIVQSGLRDLMGYGPRDYWFPEVRSVGGASIMLILVLYPYVYLLARASFLQQSGTAFMAARALGSSAWSAFYRISLPLARPAIAAGVLLTIMETIADFGTVAHFGVQTFATGIYTSWFHSAIAPAPRSSRFACWLLRYYWPRWSGFSAAVQNFIIKASEHTQLKGFTWRAGVAPSPSYFVFYL